MLRRFLPRLRDKAPGVNHVVADHPLRFTKRGLRHVIFLKSDLARVVVFRACLHVLQIAGYPAPLAPRHLVVAPQGVGWPFVKPAGPLLLGKRLVVARRCRGIELCRVGKRLDVARVPNAPYGDPTRPPREASLMARQVLIPLSLPLQVLNPLAE